MTWNTSNRDTRYTPEISKLRYSAERPMSRLRMYRGIEISERQIVDGKVKDARTSLNETRAKYGL